MNYLKFSVEDFATDDFFIRWVLQGDEESTRFWEDFKLANPHKKHTIENARILLINIHRAEQTEQPSAQVSNIWNAIEEKIDAIDSEADEEEGSFFTPIRIAATIIFLLVASAILYVAIPFGENNQAEQLASDGYVQEFNTSGSVLKIHLSDGSVVSLENNSRLSYKKEYATQSERRVYLVGEAFFDIARDPTKPFLVCANEVVTKVLGTTFRVRAYDTDNDIRVSVSTGKVSVFSVKNSKNSSGDGAELNGVVLVSNQQAIYQRQGDSFEKLLIDKPQAVNNLGQKELFNFSNEPIANVFHKLEKIYAVEIIFDSEVMGDCYLTAPLGSEPLFEKLKIICKSVGASYEQIDAKIVITSKGCGKSPGEHVGPSSKSKTKPTN